MPAPTTIASAERVCTPVAPALCDSDIANAAAVQYKVLTARRIPMVPLMSGVEVRDLGVNGDGANERGREAVLYAEAGTVATCIRYLQRAGVYNDRWASAEQRNYSFVCIKRENY